MSIRNHNLSLSLAAALLAALLCTSCVSSRLPSMSGMPHEQQARLDAADPHVTNLDDLYADEAIPGRTGTLVFDPANPLVRIYAAPSGTKSYAMAIRIPEDSGTVVLKSFFNEGSGIGKRSVFYPRIVLLDAKGQSLSPLDAPVLQFEKARLLYQDRECFWMSFRLPPEADRLIVLNDLEIVGKGGLLAETYSPVFDSMSREYDRASPEPTAAQKLERIAAAPTGVLTLKISKD